MSVGRMIFAGLCYKYFSLFLLVYYILHVSIITVLEKVVLDCRDILSSFREATARICDPKYLCSPVCQHPKRNKLQVQL